MLIVEAPVPGKTETKIERTVRRVVFEPLNQCIAACTDNETLASLIGNQENDAYMFFI
jgi:hypothetical protein